MERNRTTPNLYASRDLAQINHVNKHQIHLLHVPKYIGSDGKKALSFFSI